MAAIKRSRRVMIIVSTCFVLVFIGVVFGYVMLTKHIEDIGHSQFGTVAIPREPADRLRLPLRRYSALCNANSSRVGSV